jgi:hypothetical protein
MGRTRNGGQCRRGESESIVSCFARKLHSYMAEQMTVGPRQSAEHLFTEWTYSQRLFACFERKFKLNEKLSELEKLIGIDPSIERSLITIKRLSILRKQLYDFNHQDIKLRLINRVDEIYVIEYAIADRSDKLPLHLKIWDSHD